MRLIFTIPDLGSGGAQRVLVSLVNELCREHQVKVMKLDAEEPHYTVDPMVDVVNLTQVRHQKNRFSRWMTAMMRLRSELKKEQRTHSEILLISFLTEFSIVSMLFIPRSVPIIISEHNQEAHLTSEFWRFLRKKVYPRGDALTVLFPEDAVYYRKFMSSVEVMPNPCSFAMSCGTFEKENMVILVARLHYTKNVSMFLRAVSLLDDELKRSHRFCILGKGNLKESLIREAEALGVQVEFLGTVKNVEDFYAKAKIICLSSDIEGLPMTLIEPMFFETARVSTKSSDGIFSLIEDGVDGFLVEKDDAQAMSERMARLMRDEDLRLRIVEQANKKRKLFDVKNLARQWMDLIYKVRERRSGLE